MAKGDLPDNTQAYSKAYGQPPLHFLSNKNKAWWESDQGGGTLKPEPGRGCTATRGITAAPVAWTCHLMIL